MAFIVEVEVVGKKTWLKEMPGIFFPCNTVEFTDCKETAQRYGNRSEAEAIARRINPAYVPEVKESV